MKIAKKFNLLSSILVGLFIALCILQITNTITNPLIIRTKRAEQQEFVKAVSTAIPPIISKERIPQIQNDVSAKYQQYYLFMYLISQIGVVIGGVTSFYFSKHKKFFSSVSVGVLFACAISLYIILSISIQEIKAVSYWQEKKLPPETITQYQAGYQKDILGVIVNTPKNMAISVLFSLTGAIIVLGAEKFFIKN